MNSRKYFTPLCGAKYALAVSQFFLSSLVVKAPALRSVRSFSSSARFQAADCAGSPGDLGDLAGDRKVDLVGIDVPAVAVGVFVLCERQAPIDAL